MKLSVVVLSMLVAICSIAFVRATGTEELTKKIAELGELAEKIGWYYY